MFILPSSPRYERIPNADAHRRFLITDDVYVSPTRRVKCRVRVISARKTPSACSGAQYCGLDVFVASGWAVTPWYWREWLCGRFSGAFISDDSIVVANRDNMHMREACLPAALHLGETAYRDCTHLHIVTSHSPGWEREMPCAGDIYELDMVFVDIYQVQPNSDTSDLLARGSILFGTMDCPFVIPTEHLGRLKSFEIR